MGIQAHFNAGNRGNPRKLHDGSSRSRKKQYVTPDLFDKELQDSYGVATPEELLLAMVDDPGEYNDLAVFIQQFQGFDVSFEDKVDEAKN